jgi:hypothetical protein
MKCTGVTVLAILLAVAACDTQRSVAPNEDAPAFAAGGKIDSTSRATLVWADQVNVAAPGQPEDWRTQVSREIIG